MLRARLLTPDRSTTELATRGFHVKDDPTRAGLEAVGAHFLDGFRYALEAPDPSAAGGRLDTVERPYRGFAYEGAAMALALLDGLSPTGGDRVARFIVGPAARHVYMAYVGIGWAYAKLPQWRWRAVPAPDPLLRWLVLDGYGFYHAFFDTDRYVHRQHVDAGLRWPPDGPRGYVPRAVDQGVGRAMWFVAGADPDVAATLIGRFPAHRRADLWSGMGLAASYAGAASRAELESLQDSAGEHRPELAQGAAFAAGARVLAGLTTPHTATATEVFCAAGPEEVAAVNDGARVDLPAGGQEPEFEIWRRRIQSRFQGRSETAAPAVGRPWES
jgi:hypothetical protein